MKLLPSLIIAALLAASAGIASATTITLNSYGQTNCNPSCGSATYVAPTATPQNTVTTFAGGTTYDIPTGGVWAGPLGASSWVSQNSQNFPGGTNVENSGTYTYSSMFTTTGSVIGGTLQVLADDTTSILLNGVQLVAAASGSQSDSGTHCTIAQPNCEMVYTVDFASGLDSNGHSDLSDFTSGTNTLTFGVNQDYGSAEGLDFSGSVTTASPAPEPNTLILLGTGALSLAGVLRRKFVA